MQRKLVGCVGSLKYIAFIVQAFKRYNEGNLLDMVDPSIKEVIVMEILAKMFGLAIQCAAPIRNDRPDMKSVGEQLWAIRADYVKCKERVAE